MLYAQYFSVTICNQKKKEFLSLQQIDGIFMVEYKVRFLTSEVRAW